MSFQIRSLTLAEAIEKIKQNFTGLSNYPGHGRSERSREQWEQIKRNSTYMQREWLQEEMKKAEQNALITKIRELIMEARRQYSVALSMDHKNSETIHKLKTEWSPERVLSTFPTFKKICVILNNDETWGIARRALNRKEIAFISDAFDFIRERRVLRR